MVMVSLSVVPESLQPHGLQLISLLCPWNSPSKNTGVGCHFIPQGIFLTQGSNPCLLHWQADSLPLSHLGSPPLSRSLSIYMHNLWDRGSHLLTLPVDIFPGLLFPGLFLFSPLGCPLWSLTTTGSFPTI